MGLRARAPVRNWGVQIERVTDSASARGARDKPDRSETALRGVDSGAGEARALGRERMAGDPWTER